MLPWKNADASSEQRKFVETWLGEAKTPFTELCERFGVSPKSGYKRVARFKECGFDGLADLSRAPRTHPNATPAEVPEILIDAKGQHMTYGPRKLIALLSVTHPHLKLPAASTAG